LTCEVEEYFNQMASSWDDLLKKESFARLEEIMEDLKILPDYWVLDVGSGTGILLPYLVNRVGDKGKIVELDIAEKMLQAAREKGYCGNIEYIKSDVMSMPFRGKIFDLVLCHSSFPHFPDKEEALKEIFRVLKLGGKLAITHIDSREEVNRIHKSIGGVVADHQLPENEVLEDMLLKIGFTGIRILDKHDRYVVTAFKPS